tara:strand:+ start:416 stop:811 length:396 start_codon:yes stop_codon:yes gene_type:complete
MTIQATKYSEVIAKKVTDGIKSGVSVKDIMGSIQQYQNAPSSSATFYKLYGQLIKQTRADSVEQVGNVVYNMAIQGDFKAAEFYLRSKGGWSPNSTVNEVEQEVEPDEDLAAIDSVMSLLGKNTTPDENNS